MVPFIGDRSRNFELHDDFMQLNTALWATVDDGGTGTNTLDGTHGGWMGVVTAAADNDYHTMTSTAKSFQFKTSKVLNLEAKIKMTEANTDQGSFVVGFMDTTTTGGLQTGTSGPLASFDGAIFYKIEGTQTIKFMVSNSTTQAISTITWAFTSATEYTLRLEYGCNDGTTGWVQPYVNDVAGTRLTCDIATMAAMYALFGVKAGSGSAETLKIDYINIQGTR